MLILPANSKYLKTFDFLVDSMPFGYSFNFENYLFNKIKHINTQGINTRADYFIVNNVRKRIEAKIHFLIHHHQAFSPYKSLFGSFEFSPRIHPNLVKEFWYFIENDLKKRGVSRISIVNYSECYAPQKTEVTKRILTKSGFVVKKRAVNHHIAIAEESLESKMHLMEIRRLNKCKKSKFTFQQESHEKAAEIYDYLENCRSEQDLDMSITRKIFLDYIDQFPQDYSLFSIKNKKELLAATITVRVSRKILYNFLPGSLKKFKRFSPTVMLVYGLYEYCQQHSYEMLDLGISTEKDGKDQDSLIEFKENIGGVKSYKYFFEKQL